MENGIIYLESLIFQMEVALVQLGKVAFLNWQNEIIYTNLFDKEEKRLFKAFV